MSQGQPSAGGDNDKRNSASGLLLLLLAFMAAGVVVMIRLGTGALEMSGSAMELNKLLDQKTKTCADRARAEECDRILKQIEALQRRMNQKPGETSMGENGASP
ncbi:MAG: hypothetical protein OEV92_03835 [Nitrospinota bacterium]|nr:hypothetical protein [Nitrospinota bacterium]